MVEGPYISLRLLEKGTTTTSRPIARARRISAPSAIGSSTNIPWRAWWTSCMHGTTRPATNSSVPMMRSKPSSSWRMTWMRLNGTQKRERRKQVYRDLHRFLRAAGYPHAADWPVRLLQRCAVWTLGDGPSTQVAVWLEPLGNRWASLHLCASRESRGRWVSPGALRLLSDGARAAGFTKLIARPLPQHRPYLARLGFDEVGGEFHLSLYEQARYSQNPRSAAAGSPCCEADPAARRFPDDGSTPEDADASLSHGGA